MEAFVNQLNAIIWSQALIVLCLGLGLYFSIRTRFMQVWGVPEMIRLMFNNKSSQAGVSSFQALAMSLAGRVGTGNIAGVATAIAFGGPGAVFWMWVMAFLGASTSYVECTLAQIYKEKDDKGQYRGGPAYYIEKAMGQKWYAWIFAVVTIIACGFLLPIVQVNTLAESMTTAFGIPPWVIAAAIVLFLGLIIYGGVKRIAAFAQLVVPFMAVAYILVAFVIMALNPEDVTDMFALIFESAFGVHAGFGAMLGLAIEWGVKRGIYSNEAGQGTGPHSAAAAEVQHPAQQGFVQAFAVYVDTLLVCSATAFMILGTGMYNVVKPAGGFLYQGLDGAVAGPDFPQAAVDSVFPGWGAGFVAMAILFFVFTTLVTYYYMAETNVAYINRKVHRPWLIQVLRVVILAAVIFGVFRTTALAWGFGDIGVGTMAWLNLIAILILQKPALVALRDYKRQKDAGIGAEGDFTFDPVALGIRNAHYWEKRDAGREPDLPRPEEGDGR
ncbi:MAG TPA: alanine/glycine:cation symporter family protein [Xanthomonadaceae bacterium]|nr:alanine/glycine:cation symporter family protein [Xanthomonadaceae bacterium]